MTEIKDQPDKTADKAWIAIGISTLSLVVAIWAAFNSWQQVRIAERSLRAVSGHSVVFGTTFEAQMKTPLRHGAKLLVRFNNMSTVTQSYDVQVRSEGLFVSLPGITNDRGKRLIRLGGGRLAVAKDGEFSESFHAWFSEDPPSVATLELLIDDEVVDSVNLKYDRKTKNYVRSS